MTALRRHGSGLRVGSLYRSSPVSHLPQPRYLNTVAALRSNLDAEDLLALTKALELKAGRHPGPRHGPRPLDIDLLVFGDRLSRAPELDLPHPSLRSRRFVLVPLCDLLPSMPLPPDGVHAAELLQRLSSEEHVVRVPWRRPP